MNDKEIKKIAEEVKDELLKDYEKVDKKLNKHKEYV